MKRIFALSFSLLVLYSWIAAQEPDSAKIPRSIDLGFDISGPVIYAIDNDRLNLEGYLSYRLNPKYSIVIEGGYSNFHYEQYNYVYNSDGYYTRIGTDINLIKDRASLAKNFVGIGFRYGLSIFNQETPWIMYENYWGRYESAGQRDFINAHFFEGNISVKAELFTNFLIGWTFSTRIQIYNSADENFLPAYIPGFGATDKVLRTSFIYSLIYRIPFTN